MENRVLTLPTTENEAGEHVPSAGGYYYSRQAADKLVAYGPRVPGIDCKTTAPALAWLWEKEHSGSAGVYVVIAEASVLDKIGAGQKLADHVAASAGNKRGWPVWSCDGTMPDPLDAGKLLAFERYPVRFSGLAPANDASAGSPWRVDSKTITKARPSIPGTIAGAPDLPGEVERTAAVIP